MPVSSEISRSDFIGNGAVSAYSTTFPCKAVTEVRVIAQDADGDDLELAYSTDFTAVLNADGTVTITLVAGNYTDGYKLSLQRGIPYTQAYSPVSSGGYNPASLATALDRLAMQVGRLNGDVARCLKLPLLEAGGDTATKLPSITDRIGKLLTFDSSGYARVIASGESEGGESSGGSLGINVKSSPYLATGDGVTDDKEAIEAAISAADALGGGVVYFPLGTYYISGTTKVSVPFGVRLLGESMDSAIIRGPGFDATGDNVSYQDIEFRDPAVDGAVAAALPTYLRAQDRSNISIHRCRLNCGWIDIRNTSETAWVENISVTECEFTGDYTVWSATDSVNCIRAMGVRGLHITNNRMLATVFPHRVLKIQASTFSGGTPPEVGTAATYAAVITGNIIIGQMISGKQVCDLFSGVVDLIFQGNVIDITVAGSGASHLIECKTGQSAVLVSPWTQRQVYRGNILRGNASWVVSITGSYSQVWEDEEQSVDFSGNLIDHLSTGATYAVEFRGIHNVTCNGNNLQSKTTEYIYRAFAFGGCRNHVVSNNFADRGQIMVQGGVSTTGGDLYTGGCEQVTVVGNILRDGRSDHGVIELYNLDGTPDATIIGNTCDSSLAASIQACVYLRDSAFNHVIVLGNNGDTGDASRNRYLTVTATVVREREYLNGWQDAALQEYDAVDNRMYVGDGTTSVDIWIQAVAGAEATIAFRQDTARRLIQKITTTGNNWQMQVRDLTDVAVDVPFDITLSSGGNIALGGSTGRPVVASGVVRPSVDSTNDLGAQAQRWRNVYAQGSIHCGSRYITAAGSQAITDQDHSITVDCTLGNVTLSLPTGTSARNGKKLKIARIDNSANTLTVQRTAAPDTIIAGFTGANSFTIAGGGREEMTYIHDITAYVRDQ